MILEQYRGCFERVYILSPSEGPRGQHRPQAVLVGRLGRGRTAEHPGPAEDDHAAVEAAGHEEALPGFDRDR